MRERGWILLAVYGILLINAVSDALKATRPKFKIATTPATTTTTTTTTISASSNEDDHVEDTENEDSESTTISSAEGNGTTGHVLTGIPQIDYIWDPNLPRELNGYNLSDYPFYNSIPEDIDFKCDGLHDGFYASVPHKCQVYHHCLYGTRYDFLCANFTAFDQRTFICHFVSEVDCNNSKKYWHRNDALYKATTSSTTSTTSTSTTTTTTLPPVTLGGTGRAHHDRGSNAWDNPPRRRRPPPRRRPVYDYYDEYYDDEYDRPRASHDRRPDDYEYDDRIYRRERERDRDYRDRDLPPRTRDDRDRDPDLIRDRYPARGSRREPIRPTKEPIEDDVRLLRNRDPDEMETRIRETDERRYSDNKRWKDDYEDKEPSAPAAPTGPGNSEPLVKSSSPNLSVYSRPRTPPKIRRPVPLAEQEKYAYKATSTQPTVPGEPRRKPSSDAVEDDYYEDEFEDIRPRRPMRRRPAVHRDFYDSRDRERDRPFRSRYRDDEDDVRPRKYSRDRYYDRDRDRMMDRGRDRALDRGKPMDRDRGRSQDPDRVKRPYMNRDKLSEMVDRPRSPLRSSDSSETGEPSAPGRSSGIHDRPTTSERSTTCKSEEFMMREKAVIPEDHSEKVKNHSNRPTRPPPASSTSHRPEFSNNQEKDIEEKYKPSNPVSSQQDTYLDEYSSEYYDEPEEPIPPLPPRPTVRVVKRPFLPSRGGIPNPRGLSPVGSKAPKRDEITVTTGKGYYVQEELEEASKESHEGRHFNSKIEETNNNKQPYDAYKFIQTDIQKQRPDNYDTSISRPSLRRPIDQSSDEEPIKHSGGIGAQAPETESRSSPPLPKWNPVEQFSGDKTVNNGKNGNSSPTEISSDPYSSTYKNDEISNNNYNNNQDQLNGPASFRNKQKINEVTHRLQDIPESEYDVTLNDALTPTLNQDSNLPSGFVLPIHRQFNRDSLIQSSENNYKLTRPVNNQQQQQQQQQQTPQQQQKPFIPSPQFIPSSNINTNNDRNRNIYFRTPEAIQISGSQYRQQRGPWQDYAGY